MQHKLQNGNKKQAQSIPSVALVVSFKFPPMKHDTKKVPQKDISNVGSSSNSGSMPAKKPLKQHGTLVKGKSTPVTKSPFPIMCDFDTSSLELHPILFFLRMLDLGIPLLRRIMRVIWL